MYSKFVYLCTRMKKTILFSLLLLTLLSACRDSNKFTVRGHITEAKDSTLVLEHLDESGAVEEIQKTRLDEDGTFKLKGLRPANPEFYRLRIADRFINLSIDSTETVAIEASYPNMGTGYTVEGSGPCDTIRLLSLKLWQLDLKTDSIALDRSLTLSQRDDSIQAEILRYKDEVKRRFINGHYGSPASYYALFQSINGARVFDLENDRSDVTWALAVANAWEAAWSDARRTQSLIEAAQKGWSNTHRRVLEVDINDEKIKQTGIIDMGFPDINGRERRLSSLKGQVVVLDFTAYSMEGSAQRNLELRSLYNKYHSRGLEIYQVAIDPNEHYWKTACRQLPWVCVWNPNGRLNDIMTIYNIQRLPTWLLVDRDNNLVGRQEMLGDIESEILKLL